jgi:putative endonuclease
VTTDSRQRLGLTGERLAAEHFARLGFDLLRRRHRTRFGEIDLIVADARLIVFVEVKARRLGSGHPWDALHARKRTQVRRMAAAWLAEEHDRPRARELRFDAVGVVVDSRDRLVSLDHLEGAF